MLENCSKDVFTGTDYDFHLIIVLVLSHVAAIGAIGTTGILISTPKKGHGNISIGGMTPFLHLDHWKSLESDRTPLGFTATRTLIIVIIFVVVVVVVVVVVPDTTLELNHLKLVLIRLFETQQDTHTRFVTKGREHLGKDDTNLLIPTPEAIRRHILQKRFIKTVRQGILPCLGTMIVIIQEYCQADEGNQIKCINYHKWYCHVEMRMVAASMTR